MSEIVRVYAGFDGTYNHMENDLEIGDGSETNIAKLRELYEKQGYKALYQEGSGTVDLTDEQIDLVKSGLASKTEFYNREGGMFGTGETGVQNQVTKMIDKISPFIENIDNDQVIHIDIAGFSRGAAAARDFINQMHSQYDEKIASGKVVLDNVILYDAVASIGFANSVNIGIDLELSATSANNIYHFTALNEERSNFPLESLQDENGHLPVNIFEQALWGVHANLGAGYGLNDSVEKLLIESGQFSVLPGDVNARKNELIEEALAQGLQVEFTLLDVGQFSGIERFTYDFYETRDVKFGLANVSLALAIQRLSENGVELADSSILGANSVVAEELKPYLNALINGDDISQFEDQAADYIHTSSSNDKLDASLKDWIANFRDLDEARDIYVNEHGTLESWWDDLLQNIGRQIIKTSMANGGHLGDLEIGISRLLNTNERDIVELLIDFTNGFSAINAGVYNYFVEAYEAVTRRDPLVLDLDGDGIETTPADGSVLFDHNANGQKTATGWIAPDDGLLVLDRNDNGTIDDGRELFGDNTLKSNGELATNGFDALADLDSNQDGLIDINDTEFANLRIWQDLNQDGINQTGELKTLTQLNIQSITTDSKNVLQNLGHDNQAIAQGSFTFTDGTTSTAGAAASLNLAVNNFHRVFTDTIKIPAALQHLADMQGSGDVRDLKQAAALSPSLVSVLDNYSNATTKAEQLAQLDSLIHAWANTANFTQLTDRIDDVQIGSSTSTLKFRISDLTEEDTETYFTADELLVGRFADRRDVDTLAKIQVLEVFNNQTFFEFSIEEVDSTDNGITDEVLINIDSGNTGRIVSYLTPQGDIPSDIYIDETHITLTIEQMDFIDQAYEALKHSIYDGLLLQTRLSRFIDSIELDVVDNELVLDFSTLEVLMKQGVENDVINGLTDIIEFNLATQDYLQESSWRGGWALLSKVLHDVTMSPKVAALLEEHTILFVEKGDITELQGTDSAEVLLGNGFDNTIIADDDDIVHGGAGNDHIEVYGDNAILSGGSGNDILTASRFSSDTTFYGDQGDDRMSGSIYTDTYLFNSGDGQDSISEFSTYFSDIVDVLKFNIGIAQHDMIIGREGENLTLTHQNGVDKVTVIDWYEGAQYQIERVEFSDGSLWESDYLTLTGLHFTGTTGHDIVTGVEKYVDVLNGGAGNDQLTARGDDDVLNGDGGDDIISSGEFSANTLLSGGKGNDVLKGSDYNDTYLFKLGDGQDTIIEKRGYSDEEDVLKFDVGISQQDISIDRKEENLILSHQNGVDKITINGWYTGRGHQLELIEFADGSIWLGDFINTTGLNVTGTAGDDVLSGVENFADVLNGDGGNDHLTSLGDNDRLNGGDGDDVLRADDESINTTFHGGRGNDQMEGSSDNDLYLFNLGDGQDTIIERWQYGDVEDALKFGPGITQADVTISRDGEDLLLSHQNGVDKVTVRGWYDSSELQLERVEFSDDTSWDGDYVTTTGLNVTGTEGDDILSGVKWFTNILNGGAGNDQLNSPGKNDTLIGDDGNDILNSSGNDSTLNGGAGNDALHVSGDDGTLNGGDGDDVLSSSASYSGSTFYGGQGSDQMTGSHQGDIYLFNLGDGQDTISEKWGARDSEDILKFGIGITPDDIFITREEENLILNHQNSTDRTTVIDWFENQRYQLERVEFVDGSQWEGTELTEIGLNYSGTSGDDTLNGVDGFVETISGGEGNDNLTARGDNDTLNGDEGDDNIRASSSSKNTTFHGGKGTDQMTGSYYNDTYLFSLGDGSDTIIERGQFDSDTIDVLKLGSGISQQDITIAREGHSLILSHQNGTDKITLRNWYLDSDYRIERVEFSDGTVWDSDDLIPADVDPTKDEDDDTTADVRNGSSGDDQLIAIGDNIKLNGLGGDDILMSLNSSKNTIFNGGKGSDYMAGSYYNDTYLFNLGDGQDTIIEMGQAGTDTADILKFGSGITQQDISISRIGQGLLLSHQNATDQVIVSGWYNNSENQLERVEFADGTVWLQSYFNDVRTNERPTVNKDLIDQTSNEGRQFNYQLDDNAFTDSDVDDELIYTASLADGALLPEWLQFDADTQTFSGKPENESVGELLIKVTVTDKAGLSTNQHFSISIQNVNHAPTAHNLLIDQTSDEGNLFSYQLAANAFTDSDVGDELTFTASLADGGLLPEWLQFDAETQAFSGTPENEDVGELAITVTATDKAGLTASDHFTINIQNVNHAPIAHNLLVNQSIDEGRDFTYQLADNAFTDSDVADELTYAARLADGGLLPDWLQFDVDTQHFSGTPDNEDVGELAISVTATDKAGLSVSDDFSIQIENINDAPTANNSLIDQTSDEASKFSYQLPMASFTDIDAGDSLTLTAMLTDGNALPDWLRFDAAIQTLSGTPPHDASGDYDISIIATDTFGLSVNASFKLTINDTVVAIVGSKGNDVLVGSRNDDVIIGDEGNDRLNGNAGSDSLYGGQGNDRLYGNDGDDIIEGGDGRDMLMGHNGNDILRGGGGDDNLRGRSGDDLLVGGEGNDNLRGGFGNDTMVGGLGDDRYVVTIGDDTLIELVNEGNDTVFSRGSYILDDNIENLILSGGGRQSGTGNGLNNEIYGNAGDSELRGGQGNDQLTGNRGNDTYLFERGDGQDSIDNYDVVEESIDILSFGDTISKEQLWFEQVGNDLLITILNNDDQITVQDWYSSELYQLDFIELSSGEILANQQLETLVQAMALVGEDAVEDIELSGQIQGDLVSLLATSWQ